MLTMYSLQDKETIRDRPVGTWIELAPGPDDGKYWSVDSVYFWIDEWEEIAEPLLAIRLPGYDFYDRACIPTEGWQVALSYLSQLATRLDDVDEPAMVHIAASELPVDLRRRLERGFPDAVGRLAADLREIVAWCSATLRRWHAITVIGL